ncbi:hypothetical protein PSN45_001520 [Yamadazyma tenuis]|uniref:Uncharacterized protein n=1 Tax=Candida tenuis (strain ATCC 10573 / BCRC 21748 / CBS 615 / JCM 9827 / NBRC 10315 / NRRL Y-1498 / VKM Y-70) TaxID=590646 RepID=G3B2X7_CANTC|nr:uncharacterized protein CANTEDRAFT_104525 [Yamadazyma tenuis ATCC 10573]EGV64451.1 hypothetical protein CANTEDRAFT_104525 [Yamadazyma tenuis ATCC 10573]WEJ94042.1 hypothetical protein PSN45_001520 [Yamadazyma tenuis]
MDNRIRSISISSLKHDPEDVPLVESGRSPSWLLSETLQNFSIKDKDAPDNFNQIIIDNSNRLVELFTQYPSIKDDLMLQTIINKINFMFYSDVPQIKACGYKILKYCIANEDSLYILVQNRILIYLIITLSTDSSSDLEKIYAIKLIYRFLEVEKGSSYLSMGVIKALMHLLDDDLFIISNDLKHLIMELMLEVSVQNPQLIFHAGGFNVLIRILSSSSNIVISMNCLIIIIKLLEIDEFRQFFRNGYNLNSLLSLFDEESLGQATRQKIQKFQKVSFLLTIFLKNWNGLICCSLNNFQVLGNLINHLDGTDTKLKEFVLDILLDVLGVKSLSWLKNSAIGELLVKFNPKATFIYDSSEDDSNESDTHIIAHYMNHYKGLLTFVLIKLNLVERLITNLDTALNDKVILLLSNLFKFSKMYLPPDLNLDFSNKITLNSLIKISNYNLNSDYQNTRIPAKMLNLTPCIPKVEEADFKGIINGTKVLTIKEFGSWDWDLILLVFEGPMTNEKKFVDIMDKQPKFFKRLLSFYRPFKFRFCNLTIKTKDHRKILLVGTLIFEILTRFSNGLKYLYKNKIMIQISEIFAQIDPLSGIVARNPILSEKNLLQTLNIGYLKFVGKLSESENGLKLLNQWQFFQIIDNIIETSAESKANNFFVSSLFRYLKFDTYVTKNLVFKVLAVSNRQLKMKVIEFLPTYNLGTSATLKLICFNMYQKEFSESLVNYLYEFYSKDKDSNILRSTLKFNPSISILSKFPKGEALLNEFLLIPEGFTYLSKFDYVNTHFNSWLNDKQSFKIVQFYEYKLNKKMLPYFNVIEPVEYKFFLKNLLDTREGLNFFQSYNFETNFIEEFTKSIQTCLDRVLRKDTLTDTELRELKQNLWILGEINTSNFGIQLIPWEFFENFVESFIKCDNWVIKGMLFYQIGMLSLNSEGIEVLDESNWVIKYNKFNKFANFSYPKDLSLNLFNNTFTSTRFSKPDKYQFHSTDDLSEEEALVVELIFKFPSDLVKFKQPVKELMYLKKNHSYLFTYELFMKLIKLIDNSSFNFKKRNFIFNLFMEDTNLLELLSKKKK